MRSPTRLGAFALGLAAAIASVPASAGAATSTFTTGIADFGAMAGNDRDAWTGRAVSVGASRIRLGLNWRTVAPQQPSPADATNPGWAGYSFAAMDAQVRSVVARGLRPMLTLNGSPSWAEAPGRPKTARGGTWKPDAAAFGAFTKAVAARYSGAFPDPARPGSSLPRVAEFQLWNEPNLNIYLAPQYENGRPFAALRFRELVNNGYVGIKSVQPTATVVGAGLAPYGDPGSNPARTRPLAFLRDMLCLDASLAKTCADVTNVDVLAIHPYTTNKPSQAALDRDDVTTPDIPKMQRVVSAARDAGTVGPARPPVWVTEMHWETFPDPRGISTATRARYISEAFWRLWRADVPTAFWYLLKDEEYKPGQRVFDSYQSGLFTRGGQRKTDARAFRFPLVVTRRTASRLTVWFRTPNKGTTSVQVRRGGVWTTIVKKRKLPVNGVATVRFSQASVTAVRAFSGKAKSSVWDVD